MKVTSILILFSDFFDEAYHNLVKDLVDFKSREDFDRYMKDLENDYYERRGLSAPPYEEIPAYPPKPYAERSKHHSKNEQDFIDQVVEANKKRQSAYQNI